MSCQVKFRENLASNRSVSSSERSSPWYSALSGSDCQRRDLTADDPSAAIRAIAVPIRARSG
jgi:hypothetical protein